MSIGASPPPPSLTWLGPMFGGGGAGGTTVSFILIHCCARAAQSTEEHAKMGVLVKWRDWRVVSTHLDRCSCFGRRRGWEPTESGSPCPRTFRRSSSSAISSTIRIQLLCLLLGLRPGRLQARSHGDDYRSKLRTVYAIRRQNSNPVDRSVNKGVFKRFTIRLTDERDANAYDLPNTTIVDWLFELNEIL